MKRYINSFDPSLLLTTGILLAATSCFSSAEEHATPSSAETKSLIDPQQELRFLYPPEAVSNDGCDGPCEFRIDRCSVVSNSSALVIAKVASITGPEMPRDCTLDTYSSNYWTAELSVLSTVAGSGASVGQSLDVTLLEKSAWGVGFQPGDTILIGLRETRGEWIGLLYVYVVTGDTALGTEHQGQEDVILDLPGTLAQLSMDTQAALADYPTLCPELSPYFMNDDEFHDWSHGRHNCRQPEPASGTDDPNDQPVSDDDSW